MYLGTGDMYFKFVMSADDYGQDKLFSGKKIEKKKHFVTGGTHRLPDGKNISKISLFVLTECTNVTDTPTDTQTQTPHDGVASRGKNAERPTTTCWGPKADVQFPRL